MSKTRRQEPPEAKPKPRQIKRRKQWEASPQAQPLEYPTREAATQWKPLG